MAISEERRKKLSDAMKASHARRKQAAEQRTGRAPRRGRPPRGKRMKLRVEATSNGHVVGHQLRIIDAKIQELQELKRLLTRHRALLASVEE
jgi:hypothetical protein